MLTCQIKIKENKKDIIKQLEKLMPKAIEEVLKYGQDIALKNKRGSKSKDYVPYEIKVENKTFTGRLYTNFSWALFLEYGTGIHAEMPHIGKTRLFRFSNFYCWYAPADAVKKQYRDDQFIDINGEAFMMNAYMNGKKYVMVFSTRPYPFMRPAAFELENNAVNILTKALKDGLRK